MEKTIVTGYDGIFSSSFWGGVVRASIAQLEKLFNVESVYQDDDKTKYSLQLVADGIPFEIYDWKEGIIDENTILWLHIGTNDESETDKVVKALRGYGLSVNKWRY